VSRLIQGYGQSLVTFGSFARTTLACTFIVARCYTSPGCQGVCGWKTAHVNPNLGDFVPNPWDGFQQDYRPFKYRLMAPVKKQSLCQPMPTLIAYYHTLRCPANMTSPLHLLDFQKAQTILSHFYSDFGVFMGKLQIFDYYLPTLSQFR
jgi:hypothetical protein